MKIKKLHLIMIKVKYHEDKVTEMRVFVTTKLDKVRGSPNLLKVDPESNIKVWTHVVAPC